MRRQFRRFPSPFDLSDGNTGLMFGAAILVVVLVVVVVMICMGFGAGASIYNN